MSADIELVEVGPRDGLQNEATVLPPGERADLVARLVEAGLTRIEAVSFVRDDRVPQMAGAEDVMRRVPTAPGVRYIGLVLNARGAARAAETACTEINVVIPVTDDFATRNQGLTVHQLVQETTQAVRLARTAGQAVTVTLAVAFGCPFAGSVSTEDVARVYDQVADLGIDEIAFADTIGVGVPRQVRALAGVFLKDDRVPRLRFHFHNTRNTGYVNAFSAATLAGLDRIALDASVGGFGGCPFAPAATGNVATEDLLYLIRNEVRQATPDLDELTSTASWLAGRLGRDVEGLLARAGNFIHAEVTA